MVDFEKAKADAAEAERQANLEREIQSWKEGYQQERAADTSGEEEEFSGEDVTTEEGRDRVKQRAKQKAKQTAKDAEKAVKNVKIHTTNQLNRALNEQVLRFCESTTINGETYYKVGGRWLDTNGCDQTENMP